MSSVAFGALVRKRQEADSETSTTTGQPGLKPYVDTLAALVPAEVLALHAAVITATTKTTKNGKGENVITITDPDALELAFWGLVGLSVLFYVAGFQKRKWTIQSTVGLLIPPLAFVGWTMGQKATAFDALSPGTGQATRDVIVIIGGAALGLVAAAVSYTVHKAPAKK